MSQRPFVASLVVRTCLWSALLFGVGITGEAPFATARQPDPIDQLVSLIRARPDDSGRLNRVVDWALERDGVQPVVDRLLKAEDPSPIDLHLAGRLWEESGRTATAYECYERAIASGRPRPQTRLRLTQILLRTGWSERASEVWGNGVSGVPARVSTKIQYQILQGNGALDDASRLLREGAAHVPAEVRADWAESTRQFSLAQELWLQAERPPDAFRCALLGGDPDRAVALWTEHDFPIQDEAALRLARVQGDASLLERHLGDRADTAAERARQRLRRSLGQAQTNSGDSGSTQETSDEQEQAASEGSNERPRGPGAGTSAPDAGTTSARIAAARTVLDGSPLSSAVEGQLRGPGPPSLEVTLAWLALDRETEARREWTRWQLEPQPSEAERFEARLRAEAPGWFPLAPKAGDIIRAAERFESASRSAKLLVPSLHRSLAAAKPGSIQEAQLLYHRGRLTSHPDDLRRAATLAPKTLVGRPVGSVQVFHPLEEAARMARSPDARSAWPGEIHLPAPLGRVIGSIRQRPVRLGSYPFDVREHRGRWYLEKWTPAQREPEGTDAAQAQDFQDQVSPVLALQRVTEAGIALPLGPIHSVVHLPKVGLVLAGRGLSVVTMEPAEPGLSSGTTNDFRVRERLRIQTRESIELADLPTEVSDQLSPALSLFIRGLRPGAVPGWKEQADFLAGLRQRYRDPHITWTSTLATEGRLQLISSRGDEVWLSRKAVEPKPTIFFGYRREGDLWRLQDDSASAPVPSPTPGAPVELELVWQREIPLPTQEAPWSDPTGPEPPKTRLVPAALDQETVVATVGDDPAVKVTSGGHVLYYRGDTEYPTWIRRIETPLPGPLGFPERPTRAASRSPLERGPHRAGPFADARTPQIRLDHAGFLLLTNRVYRFDASGESQELPTPADTTFEAPSIDLELRDAVETTDATWVLLDRNRLLRYVLLPDSSAWTGELLEPAIENGFDLEVFEDSAYVLGFRRGRFALWRVESDGSSTELSLPELVVEEDRAGQRITALGRWGDELLLLDEQLYRSKRLQPHPERESELEWISLIDWPPTRDGKPLDAHRLTYYLQPRPRLVGDVLMITRPWGAVEGWRKVR